MIRHVDLTCEFFVLPVKIIRLKESLQVDLVT